MDVKFVAKQKGVLKIPCPEIGPRHAIVFSRGRARTSNKIEIRKLLSDPTATRYVSLAPGQELEKINDYLESDEQPDVMSQKFLDSIPFDAWKEIIPLRPDIEHPFPLVGMAKASLLGKAMDDNVERLKAEYLAKQEAGEIKGKVATTKKTEEKVETETEEKVDEKVEEKEEETTDQEKPVKKVKIGKKVAKEQIDITTADLTVREAIDIINDDHPYEYLENFIAEGEDRKTIQKAWNDHYPEHPVEVSE